MKVLTGRFVMTTLAGRRYVGGRGNNSFTPTPPATLPWAWHPFTMLNRLLSLYFFVINNMFIIYTVHKSFFIYLLACFGQSNESMHMWLLGPSQESTLSTDIGRNLGLHIVTIVCRLRENKRKGRGKRVKNVEEKEETGRRREKFRLKC